MLYIILLSSIPYYLFHEEVTFGVKIAERWRHKDADRVPSVASLSLLLVQWRRIDAHCLLGFQPHVFNADFPVRLLLLSLLLLFLGVSLLSFALLLPSLCWWCLRCVSSCSSRWSAVGSLAVIGARVTATRRVSLVRQLPRHWRALRRTRRYGSHNLHAQTAVTSRSIQRDNRPSDRRTETASDCIKREEQTLHDRQQQLDFQQHSESVYTPAPCADCSCSVHGI